jgi:tetratricopeptide (TPR) repeat protein
MLENYYHVLGVNYNVSPQELKLAYRKLAKQYHPDVNPDDTEKEEMFKLVSEAYYVLSDSDRKASYDLSLLLGLNEVYDELEEKERRRRYRQRPAAYRGNYRPPRREPVTYSKTVYVAVTTLVVVVALSILIIPFALSHYSSAYHYDKGMEYYQDKQYYAALNSLQHAIIDFGSKDIEACLLSGNILMEEYGQYSYAIEYADMGLERASTPLDKVQLLYLKGMCLKRSGDYHGAIEQFEVARQFWPQYDSLYHALGTTYAYDLGDFRSAKKVIDHLVTLNANFVEAYITRAYCNYHLEDYEQASADIENYLARDIARDADIYIMQARVADKLQQSEQACSAIKKASLYNLREAERLKDQFCL